MSCQSVPQTPRKLLGRTEDRFWPDFADIKHDYTQEFYQSYSSFISQCPRTGKSRGVCTMFANVQATSSPCISSHGTDLLLPELPSSAPGWLNFLACSIYCILEKSNSVILSNICRTKSQNLNVSHLVLQLSFCPIHWTQVLSQEWRCSWGSADRRCSIYIWVINNFIAY